MMEAKHEENPSKKNDSFEHQAIPASKFTLCDTNSIKKVIKLKPQISKSSNNVIKDSDYASLKKNLKSVSQRTNRTSKKRKLKDTFKAHPLREGNKFSSMKMIHQSEMHLLNDDDKKLVNVECEFIRTVYENRTNTDEIMKQICLNNLKRVQNLLDNSKNAREIRLGRYTKRYFNEHVFLISHLISIIAECKDFNICTHSTTILHTLLIRKHKLDKNDTSRVENCIAKPEIFSQLLKSLHSIYTKFHNRKEYKIIHSDVFIEILEILNVILNSKNCRKHIRKTDEEIIRFFCKLITMNEIRDSIVEKLLPIIRTICVKKRNCEFLSHKNFYINLYHHYKQTHKMLNIISIIKLMSRNKTALKSMSHCEKIFDFILELINYNGKTKINKQSLITILGRLTKSEHSLKYLSKKQNFDKLLYYFLNNSNNLKQHSNRISIIKAYTILNRCKTRIILPTTPVNTNLHIPGDVSKIIITSLTENSESSEESDSEEEKDEEEDSDDDEDIEDTPNIYSIKTKTPLEDMSRYFRELSSESIGAPETTTNLSTYENITSTDIKTMPSLTLKPKNAPQQAYPDTILLKPTPDQKKLKHSVNFFNKVQLTKKLLNDPNQDTGNKYKPRIVYDLDQLHKQLEQKPPKLPQPDTFIPGSNSKTTKTSQDSLQFESRFECGNLRKVTQVEQYEYDLLLSPDTFCCKGFQWFYFQITAMIPGIVYTFNIVNFSKQSSQYNYGMQPLLFSVVRHAKKGVGWSRCGENIVYYGNRYVNEDYSLQYKTLSFSLIFEYPNDYVYLAHHYPYTYTRLMATLFPLSHRKSESVYSRIEKLCDSISSNYELPLITVTAAEDQCDSLKIPYQQRPLVFITARVHPGETNSSWIMEGIIKFLFDDTNTDAKRAREHFIFKIIPMLNPEGVIYGNTRNGLVGFDLNRTWAKPNKSLCPEIYYPKVLIGYARHEMKHPIAAYIDIHGHSKKRFVFFYGCNCKKSWNREDKKRKNHLEALTLLPKAVRALNSNIKLSSCKYNIKKCKESTGRVVMWREYCIQQSFTLECSYCSGANKRTVDIFTLLEIGVSLVTAFGKIAERHYMLKETLMCFELDYRYLNLMVDDKKYCDEKSKVQLKFSF